MTSAVMERPPVDETPPLRVAPGVVTTLTAPVVVGVRPFAGPDGLPVEGVWEALIDDKDGGPLKVIKTEGPKVIRFIEKTCVTTQARWAGQPFDLMPWQKGLIIELFELVWSAARRRWVRRYHEALIGTPKKNGKSDWLAAVGMYLLVGTDEPSPIVIAAAANEISAKLVFTPAKTMVELSKGSRTPEMLSDLCDAWDSQILPRGVPNAEMRKVPASPKATEGLNIFANLMDEWHEWTTPAAEQTATKLQNGTALRPDYLNLRTTTAGHDPESMCGQDYEFGCKVASGEVDAPEWFFRWYEAPREFEFLPGQIYELDWRSELAIVLANPSYGVLAQWGFYENKLRRPKESEYRRYFLNQWAEVEAMWLPPGAWEACESKIKLLPGFPTAIGWDASTKHDSTALAIAQRQGERVVLRARIWERPLDPNTRKPVDEWLIPIEEVKEQVWEWFREFHPHSAEYDPAFISWEAATLKALGLPMREFPQSSLRKMSEAAQAFYEHVVAGEIAHNGDRKLTQHIKAAVARQLTGGSAAWTLVKGKARKKMDAAVACVMAIWGLDHPDLEKPKKKAPNLFIPNERKDE